MIRLVDRPRTRYAKSGDVSVAYQVAGDADLDLVCAPPAVSHLDLEYDFDDSDSLWQWERYLSFCRLIRFDKRGTGLSDRVPLAATMEERTDDIRAVMDACGSERAVIFGASEGGSMACLFAATYPERTRALVVLGAQASWVQAPDMPWGTPREELEQRVADLAATGVTDDYIRGWGVGFGPDVPQDWVDDLHRFIQAGASPASLVALERMNMDIDIRGILASIRVPTLILNASHDPVSPIEGARYLAERIPGARLVEYPGTTHPWINREQCAFILDEIEEFVTGARPTSVMDRVLTTVLFTDIVDSTKTTAELGDEGWTMLRAAHDARARAEFTRFRGIEIDHAGDGFLSRFDGPARAVRCALAIGEAVADLGLKIRAGLHTGEVELTREGVQGLAVNIGARVGALAGSSEVWVSSTVKDLVVGSNITFEDAGEHDLKGVPGRWHLFRVKT